jgi:hypothetical protein
MERFDWTTYTGPAILKISSHYNIGRVIESFQKISTLSLRRKFLLSARARGEKSLLVTGMPEVAEGKGCNWLTRGHTP